MSLQTRDVLGQCNADILLPYHLMPRNGGNNSYSPVQLPLFLLFFSFSLPFPVQAILPYRIHTFYIFIYDHNQISCFHTRGPRLSNDTNVECLTLLPTTASNSLPLSINVQYRQVCSLTDTLRTLASSERGLNGWVVSLRCQLNSTRVTHQAEPSWDLASPLCR